MSPCACEKSGLVPSNWSVGRNRRNRPRPAASVRPRCLSVLRAFCVGAVEIVRTCPTLAVESPAAQGARPRARARRHVENRGCPNRITIRPFSVPAARVPPRRTFSNECHAGVRRAPGEEEQNEPHSDVGYRGVADTYSTGETKLCGREHNPHIQLPPTCILCLTRITASWNGSICREGNIRRRRCFRQLRWR